MTWEKVLLQICTRVNLQSTSSEIDLKALILEVKVFLLHNSVAAKQFKTEYETISRTIIDWSNTTCLLNSLKIRKQVPLTQFTVIYLGSEMENLTSPNLCRKKNPPKRLDCKSTAPNLNSSKSEGLRFRELLLFLLLWKCLTSLLKNLVCSF